MVDEDVLSRSFCAVGGGVLACVLKALENNKKRRSHYEMMTLVENEKITMHNDGRFIITSFAAAGIERGEIIVHKTQPTKQGRWRIAWLSSALCAWFFFMIYALELTITSWCLMILDQGLWQSIWWKLNYLDLNSARQAQNRNFLLVLKNRILNLFIKTEHWTIDLNRFPICDFGLRFAHCD